MGMTDGGALGEKYFYFHITQNGVSIVFKKQEPHYGARLCTDLGHLEKEALLSRREII